MELTDLEKENKLLANLKLEEEIKELKRSTFKKATFWTSSIVSTVALGGFVVQTIYIDIRRESEQKMRNAELLVHKVELKEVTGDLKTKQDELTDAKMRLDKSTSLVAQAKADALLASTEKTKAEIDLKELKEQRDQLVQEKNDIQRLVELAKNDAEAKSAKLNKDIEELTRIAELAIKGGIIAVPVGPEVNDQGDILASGVVWDVTGRGVANVNLDAIRGDIIVGNARTGANGDFKITLKSGESYKISYSSPGGAGTIPNLVGNKSSELKLTIFPQIIASEGKAPVVDSVTQRLKFALLLFSSEQKVTLQQSLNTDDKKRALERLNLKDDEDLIGVQKDRRGFEEGIAFTSKAVYFVNRTDVKRLTYDEFANADVAASFISISVNGRGIFTSGLPANYIIVLRAIQTAIKTKFEPNITAL